MEDNLIEELYGDLDDCPSTMCSHDEEDSVDIYSGLESSPNGNGNKRKVNNLLSPRTIESMDMYEELIKEEQKEKEATSNELRQKFEAAQLQVKELISKLQLLQTKNSSLNNENTLLKKNICSLIKTARMEIVRKDEEISRLSNRSGRGCYGQIFHQSPMELVQLNTRHSLNNALRVSRQDRVASEINKTKDKNTVLDKATASTVAPQPFEVLQRCPRIDLENPLNHQNKNSAASKTIHPEQEHGCVNPNRTSNIKHPTMSKVTDASNFPKTCYARVTVPSTTSDSLGSLQDNKGCSLRQVEKSQTHTSHDKERNLLDKDASQKSHKKMSKRTEGEIIKASSVSSEATNHLPQVPVIFKKSGISKSPSSQTHKALSSEVSSQPSKSSLKTTADMETPSQESIQDTDRSSKETRHSGFKKTALVDEASHFQNNKIEKQGSSGHQRKEEKRQVTSSSTERRSSRTDRHRERENRPKENGRTRSNENHSRNRDRQSNKSESRKEYEQRSAKESDKKEEDKKCSEGRSRKQADALDDSRIKCDSQGNDDCKGKSSSRIDDSLLNSKKSKSHDNFKRSPDKKASSDKYCSREKVKHRDRERKRDNGSNVKMLQKGGKSKTLGHNKDQKDSLPKKDRGVGEGQQSKDDQNKQHESLHTESLSSVAINSNPSKTKMDNSPDRKLSFMETLNLTLSPLKKQRSSSDFTEPVGATVHDAFADNGRTSELSGEEFFVIDELKNNQQCVDEINKDSVTTTIDKQSDLASSSKQLGQVNDLFTSVTSEKSSTEENYMEAVDEVPAIETISKKKETDKTSDLNALDKYLLSKLNPAKHSQNSISQDFTENIPGTIDNPVSFNNLSSEMSIKLTVSKNTPDSEERSTLEIQPNSQDSLPAGICQANVSSSDKGCVAKSNSSQISQSSVTMEVFSSTITADDQSTAICNVTEMSTSKQDNERASNTSENLKPVEISQTSDNVKMAEKFHQSSLWSQNTTAASTTIREETTSSMQASFSEPGCTEKDEQNLKLSSLDVLCHDEDSMMLTLKNIKVIPEAISPLTSPVRPVKRVQPLRADKQPHVKSLSKDLSNTASDKVNTDMNKENESPDSSVTSAPQKGTVESLAVSGTEEEEIEDGEIVSESEEEGPLFIQTPPREQDKATSGSHSSPKLSSVGKRATQKKSCVPVKYSNPKSSVTPASTTSPTSAKRRFKTVNMPLIAAVHTLEEFMERLTNIRVKLRKKYMKLHKNVTNTAFCCTVDMSQASFTEFVNAVDFDKLCHQGNNIKVKLNKIITSIMSKVTKNGIVNRIFDQKAGDLKQKLWTFVDGQFDFMFKELRVALKYSSELSVNACSTEDKNTTIKGKEVVEKDLETSVHRAKKAKIDTGNCVKETPIIKLPPSRGLGSRGKNIKAVMQEDEPTNEKTSQKLNSSSEKPVLENSVFESNSPCIRHLSNNGSTHDKSDFEILTEQQASSLTYNLVSDSQMGEIFKCLLQGSDLLEAGLPVGDSQCWPVSTPRKEEVPGDSLIGIMTPNKTTPFKFITSWSSISPYKFSSNSKMLVDPAILDESCLLEVPSSSELSQPSAQSTVTSQRSFSILAEDLAVSLTIPSPLKSDSHLSFLHPGTGQPLSAPNSIMSAHYSEDALDGEDPTEQDIHLSLDTDNSSCGSSPDRTWEDPDPSGFQFKPNLPMQAVVMEKSNDHFIVRIRHTSTSPIDSGQNEMKQSLLAAEQEPAFYQNHSPSNEDLGPTQEDQLGEILVKSTESCHISEITVDALPSQKSSSEDGNDKAKQVFSDAFLTVSSSEEVKATVERVSRKRKEHHSEKKAKRPKTDRSQEKHHKSRHTRRSKSPKETSPKVAVSPTSSSSLSAKNVIRKKGEVVVTWTREEDRDILVELKMKGSSPKTFAALSKRLKKSTEQIEERFGQLLKLFKKKEKMEN